MNEAEARAEHIDPALAAAGGQGDKVRLAGRTGRASAVGVERLDQACPQLATPVIEFGYHS